MTTTRQAVYWHHPGYLSVSATHFFVDTLNNGRSVLVALLAVTLGLSNAQVGMWLLLYNVGSALAQPFFGLLVDRIGPRWIIIGGHAWMIAGYSVAALVAPMPSLLAITLAGFGSGAVHPAATLYASQASTERRTQATAVFFMLGQFGLFLGPIVTGLLIDNYGSVGYLAIPATACIVLFASYLFVQNGAAVAADSPVVPALPSRFTGNGGMVAALVGLMLLINSVSISIMNFAPKLFAQLGYSAGYAGAMSGLWMLGSAVGGVVGGLIADRANNRWAIGVGLAGVVLPLYLFLPAGDNARLLVLVVAGFFGGMPHSVMVLLSQWLMPGRQALASGLSLGIMFMGGALGSYLLGFIADQIGLATALQGLTLVPIVCLPLIFFLPRRY